MLMDFKEFMEVVDHQLVEMTDQEKVAWIQDQAKKQPDNKREDF